MTSYGFNGACYMILRLELLFTNYPRVMMQYPAFELCGSSFLVNYVNQIKSSCKREGIKHTRKMSSDFVMKVTNESMNRLPSIITEFLVLEK